MKNSNGLLGFQTRRAIKAEDELRALREQIAAQAAQPVLTWTEMRNYANEEPMMKEAQPVPKGYVKASEAIDVRTIHAQLHDIWCELNAVDTVLGDQYRLMSKVEKLRDACGSAVNCLIPLVASQPVEPTVKESLTDQPVAWIKHEWAGTGQRFLLFERTPPMVRDEVVNPVWTPLYTTPPNHIAALRQALEAMEDFRSKVHTGRAKSIDSYDKFTAACKVLRKSLGEPEVPSMREQLLDEYRTGLDSHPGYDDADE